MLTELVRQIPMYSHLPQEQLQGEILDILNYNLAIFFRILREGGRPTPEDLVEVRASAARRAEERIPLEAVLTAYHVGALVAWEALREEARDNEQEEMLRLATHVMAYIEAVTSAVAGAYLEERQAIYGEEREARRALAEALLSGGPSDALAQRAGYHLAPGYLVVSVFVATSPDESDEGVEGVVASRRKLRRMERFITSGWSDALSLLGSSGGPVLIPVRADSPKTEESRLPDLMAGVAEAAGAAVTAGVSYRPGFAGVPVAGAEAAEVLRLATELGRPPGLYVLDDVLLEFLVTRPSEAGSRLAGVLTALDHGPELVETLQGYFDADLDRKKAANALNIHPNTLDYRLKRVSELTGLSAGSARGLQVLGAALVARRLSRS
ncbi:MAG: hypothetical protein QOG87_278 [Actinomycetota bacterium]